MSENYSKILLDRFLDGDSQAASEVHARYAERLLKLARSRIFEVIQSKIDPQDIAQEAFASFFDLAAKGRVNWQKEGDLWRLLSGIVVKQVFRQVEHLNADKRSVARESSIDNEVNFSEENDELAVLEMADLLDVVLKQKPLSKRILLARLAGYDQREIAVQVGRSERTVRRILNSMKEHFAAQFDVAVDTPVDKEFRIPSKLGAVKINEYDLLRMVGVGQFGKVYLGRENRTGVKVAVKVLKKSWVGDKISEGTLLNEVEALRKLDHPGVVSLVSAGRLPNGSLFLVTQFADGVTLRKRLEQCPDSTQIKRWLMKTLEAIRYLHELGIVHGDLQPSNIVVDDREVKLVDFGFSSIGNLHSASFLGGTEGFIAPERQSSFDADIYSFGKLIEYSILHSAGMWEENWKEVVDAATQHSPNSRPSAIEVMSKLK